MREREREKQNYSGAWLCPQIYNSEYDPIYILHMLKFLNMELKSYTADFNLPFQCPVIYIRLQNWNVVQIREFKIITQLMGLMGSDYSAA